MIVHVLLQKNLEKIGISSLNRLLVDIADLTGTLLGITNLKKHKYFELGRIVKFVPSCSNSLI